MLKDAVDKTHNSQQDSQHPNWLNKFVNIYQTLSTTNLHLLSDIYHDNIIFIDPMHQIQGFNDLSQYFEKLYQNLSTCHFQIDQVIYDGEQAAIYWNMSYQHPKLNRGEVVTVYGNSHIKGNQDKVIFHRDYLDLGAMLYEQLPVFGKFTQWIKNRAAK
ncbi:nuclear transport factor 2 family protein [Paraglaciecola aquimarina]|uniref:Nuclear transport factor 2 family protein n=1 Tax=Paraglaciecola algarum TaxID=3050085 RepID=A0ABS9DBS0_9ALTE|nr:nuclear transport factor 2 family protein [Paraglaciecola sp. G1-23]MCF2949800.1 nuclear transport factor 2 family protein [Paraglaciecola sp. G1-23]